MPTGYSSPPLALAATLVPFDSQRKEDLHRLNCQKSTEPLDVSQVTSIPHRATVQGIGLRIGLVGIGTGLPLSAEL
jgi:hypothetical protein